MENLKEDSLMINKMQLNHKIIAFAEGLLANIGECVSQIISPNPSDGGEPRGSYWRKIHAEWIYNEDWKIHHYQRQLLLVSFIEKSLIDPLIVKTLNLQPFSVPAGMKGQDLIHQAIEGEIRYYEKKKKEHRQ
jgi:hypothetical protein